MVASARHMAFDGAGPKLEVRPTISCGAGTCLRRRASAPSSIRGLGLMTLITQDLLRAGSAISYFLSSRTSDVRLGYLTGFLGKVESALDLYAERADVNGLGLDAVSRGAHFNVVSLSRER